MYVKYHSSHLHKYFENLLYIYILSYREWQTMKQEGNVIFCPITKEEWEAKEKQSDCIGQNVYHCLVDYKGWKWEKCVEQSLIKKGICWLHYLAD